MSQVPVMTSEEKRLHELIFQGVVDHSARDRPMDASTRSMRYSAVLADYLSSMLRAERDRVRGFAVLS